MEIDEKLKNKVRNAVSLYKDIFSKEYNLVVKQIDVERKKQKNENAEVIFNENSNEGIKREMYRIPEKLDTLINTNLAPEEWYTIETREYAYWFMKEFPEFKMSNLI